MKKTSVFARSNLPTVLAVMLFISFVQPTRAQSQHQGSTTRPNALVPAIVVYKTGTRTDLLYDFGKARFLVDSVDTHGAWSLVEITELPGYKTLLHRHNNWDESFYVLEGTLTAKVADSIYTMPAGSYVLIPRGTPHGQANFGTVPVKLLLTITPSGFERHLQDRVELFKKSKPDSPEFPGRMDSLRKKNAQYIEILGTWTNSNK
jgi:mannose-6-phosphate isomerase-like protein (cupin superfamily)